MAPSLRTLFLIDQILATQEELDAIVYEMSQLEDELWIFQAFILPDIPEPAATPPEDESPLSSLMEAIFGVDSDSAPANEGEHAAEFAKLAQYKLLEERSAELRELLDELGEQLLAAYGLLD